MSKIITYTELAKHDKAGDLWMVIGGKVYDCSDYVDEHPGGEEVMLDCGGMDATGPFDDIGHSEDARELLENMYIGDIEPSDKNNKRASTSTAVSGGEDNIRLIIAIVVVILAVLSYFLIFAKKTGPSPLEPLEVVA